jgi:hypothetical protein
MDKRTALTSEQIIILFEAAAEMVTASDITFEHFADIVLLLLEDVPGLEDESERQEVVKLLWVMHSNSQHTDSRCST